MDIPEESNAQVAKRKAIQEVMRDGSLSPQERQQKIRQIIAAAAEAVEPALPANAAHPVQSVPTDSPPAQDVSDEQRKMPAFSSKGTGDQQVSPAPASGQNGDSQSDVRGNADTNEQSPASNASEARQAMTAIMRDRSLTAQEKQRRIQQVMASTNTNRISIAASAASRSEPGSHHSGRPSSTVENNRMRFGRSTVSATSPGAVGVPGTASTLRSSASGQPLTDEEIKQAARGQNRPPAQTVTTDSVATPPGAVGIAGLGATSQSTVSDHSLTGHDDDVKQRARGGDTSSVQTANVSPATETSATRSLTQEERDRHIKASASLSGRVERSRGASTAAARQKMQQQQQLPSSPARSQCQASATPTASSWTRNATEPDLRVATKMQFGHNARPRVDAAATAVSHSVADSATSEEQRIKQTILSKTQQAQESASRNMLDRDPESERPRQSAQGYIPEGQRRGAILEPPDTGHANADRQSSAAAELRQFERDIVGKSAGSMPDDITENAVVHHSEARNSLDRHPPVFDGMNQPRQSETTVHSTSYSAAVEDAPAPSPPIIDQLEQGGIEAFVADTNVATVGVATVIDEHEEEKAEEMKRRRLLCRVGGVICLCSIVIIVVLVLVFSGGGDGDGDASSVLVPGTQTSLPTSAPSSSPTSTLFADLLDTIRDAYDDNDLFEEAFGSTSSPQFRAALWAAEEGSLGLSAADPRMMQRYALATIYFATNGDSWTACGRGATQCAQEEWLETDNECEWMAVICEAGILKSLIFPPSNGKGYNLVGTLPYEIALLSNMEIVLIEGNKQLTGTIPLSWSPRLTSLRQLLLPLNGLSGSFPSLILTDNSRLEKVSLSGNKFKGSLSALGIGSTTLKTLELSDNEFSGTIPAVLSKLPALRVLDLDNNGLRGTIPEELYSLSELRFIRLFNNPQLSGTLSESIISLSNLLDLRVQFTGIGGQLPMNLFNAIGLEFLFLNNAEFFGTIPDEISQLVRLKDGRFHDNAFSGPLPSTLEFLTPLGNTILNELRLHGNDLTGNITDAICVTKGDNRLNLQFLTADCAGDDPEVICACCDECY